jgi:hypothetical protein
MIGDALEPHACGAPLVHHAVGFSFEVFATDRVVDHRTPRLATQCGRALAALHRLAPSDAASASVASQEARPRTLRETRAATTPILRKLLPAHEGAPARATADPGVGTQLQRTGAFVAGLR